MNSLKYKDGKLTLIIDGREIDPMNIADPMDVSITADRQPTALLEVILDELDIDNLTPIVNKYSNEKEVDEIKVYDEEGNLRFRAGPGSSKSQTIFTEGIIEANN